MSRLESMIRRLKAQVSCLNAAMDEIQSKPGVAFELGLGNGRTYDHLRDGLGNHEIFVFDRDVRAHPACIPDNDHLFVGDLEDTLPPLVPRFAGQVVMIHSDVGASEPNYTSALARLFAETFPVLLAPGGVVLSDKPMDVPGTMRIATPEDVPPDRYFMYRLGHDNQ